MTPATAAKEKANTSTAASTDRVCPRPMRRNTRTNGAINRLKMTAKVIGTSTSRAKYSNANSVAVAIIPKARSRLTNGKGSGAESGGSMRYIRILPGDVTQ
jgi:hypothetical protein